MTVRVEIIRTSVSPLIRIREDSGAEKYIELQPSELLELQRALMLASYELRRERERRERVS
jgi:hypothetical protein